MEEVPFDDRRVPKAEIDWERSLWWWYPLTRAMHPAIRMSSLAFSLLAVVIVTVGWRLGIWLFQPDVPDIYSPLGAEVGLFDSHVAVWQGALLNVLAAVLRPSGLNGFAFWTFEIFWGSLTVSVFGGILARRAMVELGQRTVAPWFHSVQLVAKRWQSYLWSAGMNLVGIGGLLLIPVVLGLISRLGTPGAVVGGVFLLLSFPVVFAVGRFVLSLVVCFPLSVCAISAEKKADAFEGFSRSNAYFFQRPVVAFLFGAGLFACGYVGEQVVAWTLNAGWSMVRNTYLYSGGMSQPAAERFVSAGNWLTRSLIAAYWFSYFWSASGALYLLLRRSVDHTELSEMDLAEQAVAQELPQIPAAPGAAAEPAGDAAIEKPAEG